jgi:hypothetical protein
MKPMLPFIDEEVFVPMEGTDFLNDSEGDDPMIKDIIESFTHYEENLVFDQLIESLVPFKRMDKEAGTNESVEEPYFVSMPLFEFPYIIDINYPQLAHIRGELMQALEVFHDDFENSNTELRSMLYKTDKEKIQHYLHKFISPHLEEIQKAIDKNVYIQQEKNRYRSDQRIKVMMGVTSYENQIRLLEKEEIIQPYIADSIIEKLAKNFDVRCCTPFIYHIYPENIITQ